MQQLTEALDHLLTARETAHHLQRAIMASGDLRAAEALLRIDEARTAIGQAWCRLREIQIDLGTTAAADTGDAAEDCYWRDYQDRLTAEEESPC